MAKNAQGSSDGVSRKERRAAERAARKGESSGSSTPGSSSGPSMLVISIGAIVVGLILVAVLVLLSGGLGGGTAVAMPPDEKVVPVELRDGRSLGDPAAPVTIEAFEDPQCPACGLFTERIEPLLVNGPIKDGTVYFTFKDFAFLGPESFDAATAMRVADAMDDKFWDYHAIVYHNQDGENQGAFSLERLADMAEAIGLDRAEFLDLMQDPQYLQAVQAEVQEGQQRGVKSTPTLFINGELRAGVPDWNDLRDLIDAKAAEAAS
jgi:protein-disulfide isomerase